MTNGDGAEERFGSGETDSTGVSTGEVEGESDVVKSVLSGPAVVLTVSSGGLAMVVVAVVVVVVDCPLLCPLSLDLSLDLSLGLLVPTRRRETCISPFASAPMISPLPSSSPFPFSSPRLLSSPLFFFPLPLPPLPLGVTVCSFLLPGCVVVSVSMRTQPSPVEEVTSGVGPEAVEVCHSEFSELLVLSVAMVLVEKAEVEA